MELRNELIGRTDAVETAESNTTYFDNSEKRVVF